MIKSALLFLGLGAGSAYAVPSHDELFNNLALTLQKHNVNEMELCIESVCQSYPNLVWPRKAVSDKPGANDTVGADGAAAVGGIIGDIGKQVGAGGRVVVDYERKPDGYLKIRVEASFGVGSAASAAASAEPPLPPSKADL